LKKNVKKVFKNVTKIKKTFVNVIKNVTSSQCSSTPRLMPKKWPRGVFQVIRHATEKSYIYFVAVILKVLLVNLLTALNFANVL